MAKKGFIIVEGATAFCSNSIANNSKATAVPMQVKSQKKKLRKNKYFAQNKPIATYLDDTADNFGGGTGFNLCKGPDGKPYSCKAKCNLKYKDYYENVEFNKSMKILLDVSTAICPGYGVPGTVSFATTGQSNNISQIDVKEADEFSVANISPQWETSTATETSTTSVASISMSAPLMADKISGTYYYLKLAKQGFPNFPSALSFISKNLTLTAKFKGDSSKIIWAIFKGEGTKNKVKTFTGLGSVFNQDLEKIFEDQKEGKYRIEAYGKKAGDNKCAIIIEVVSDFVKSIKSPGSSSLINIPVPFSVELKLESTQDKIKTLNLSEMNSFFSKTKLYWRVKQESRTIYNNSNSTNSQILDVKNIENQIIITFKNAGKYSIEAFTDPNDPKPEFVDVKIENTLGLMGVKGDSGLLRYNDALKVEVSEFNVKYLPNTGKTVHWYLKKDGVGRISAFENSASFSSSTINKSVGSLLVYDAKFTNAQYFGKYILEAYANPIAAGKQPSFSGSDCFHFEVIRNTLDKFTLPATIIPKGTKIKYAAEGRISKLIGNEVITLELPPNVLDNKDGTLTFEKLGEYSLVAYLAGDYTDDKKILTKIKVSDPAVKRALWAYNTGVKRTESGFAEETYGFLEIEGLQNQALKVKVWVKGDGDGFYKEKEKYLLEEKSVTLDSEGKASFLIETTEEYKTKLKTAVPRTSENPNPKYRLTFTIELQANTSADIILPGKVGITGTRPVVIDDGTTYLEVLDTNEELTITSEQKIVSIMFSTEDGKDIQRAQTFYGKTHKIWVHTVNMADETLKIDVLKEVPKEGLNETDHIIYTHESKENYKEEKVGKDGLLEVSFTPKPEWKDPPKNFDYYIAQVSRLFVDPKDNTKHIWNPEKIQLTINNTLNASLVRTEDMEKLGIKAYKEDGTAFTQDEMLELRKQFIFYESGCLKVSQLETPEVIDNDVVPVVVEMAEVRKQKTCYCDRPFSVDEMKNLVKTINGKEDIWSHSNCKIDDKSYERLTHELNSMFAHYDINECIQKIAFLAMTSVETGFFQTAGEIVGDTASSNYHYSGRGILQLTGSGSKPVIYTDYQATLNSKIFDIINNPDLVATNIHLAVDSGGFVWKHVKVVRWENRTKKKDETQADYEAKMKAFKWKREKFSKGIGKSLNETALLMKENEEDYFFLIARMLQGYLPKSTSDYPETLHYERRKENLQKLKIWFKFDKNVCDDSAVILDDNDILSNPEFNYVKVAGSFIGTSEFSKGNNPVITTFFTETGYKYDEGTSWCASFQNYCLLKGNPEIPKNNALNAVSFSYSGYEEVETPFYGSYMVRSDSNIFYKAGSYGHVAIVVGIVGNAFAQLGGNQAVPGESSGTTVNVVLRERANNVKYFHPTGVPKIKLGKPLFTPAEKTASKDTGNMTK